ncbi:hypothetical protein [Micromonospora sp. C95]|uniref:hypothetical protein n=1 Tax=Micromonospora sp. C95 TaxID=2824882 RepID=UPI001B39A45F|nr:hypothetical protein [Micromonospora sp. C95]MBQ1023600.1 hypothetical protein [Micromonospora sp. C95]
MPDEFIMGVPEELRFDVIELLPPEALARIAKEPYSYGLLQEYFQKVDVYFVDVPRDVADRTSVEELINGLRNNLYFRGPANEKLNKLFYKTLIRLPIGVPRPNGGERGDQVEFVAACVSGGIPRSSDAINRREALEEFTKTAIRLNLFSYSDTGERYPDQDLSRVIDAWASGTIVYLFNPEHPGD